MRRVTDEIKDVRVGESHFRHVNFKKTEQIIDLIYL